jgi:biotin transport system substrate-specific component
MNPSTQLGLRPGNPGSALKQTALIASGAAVTALASQIWVPFWPVPMTLQTLAVLGCGLMMGSKRAAMAQLIYLTAGAAGLPVFAEMKFGPAVVLGPTGGYLMGFVLAAGLVGYLSEKGWQGSLAKALVSILAGEAVIFVLGIAWLRMFVPNIHAALSGGLYPFLPSEALKAVILLGAVPAFKNLASKHV